MHWKKLNPPDDVCKIFKANTDLTIASSVEMLADLACGGANNDFHEVSYTIPGYGKFVEAYVARVRNGIAVNYTSPYMRRRDPDAIIVGDDFPSDKPTFKSRYDKDF